jgi:hypothetical protein
MSTRRGLSVLAAVALLAGLFTFGAGSVAADAVCSDCQNPSITTPLGAATIAVSSANVVTVDFVANDPSHTFVAALPFAIPPGPPARGFIRNSLVTVGGTINIDTVSIPPGPPGFGSTSFAGLVVVSIHPPSPCRMTATRTATQTIVVFTPRT